MNSTISIDGTQIAYEKSGNGKPIIIIGGSLADHQMYVPLANELSKSFTVFNYDRRNRGESGKTSVHTTETELQDLEAIVSLCNETPTLYGHSAGAALAIRAVAGGLQTHKLILSDLPFSVLNAESENKAKKFEQEAKSIKALLSKGNKVEAVKFFLKDFGMNEQELNDFVESNSGNQAVSNSNTLLIDYEILGNGLTPSAFLKSIPWPTLVLTSDYGLAVANDTAKYLSNCKLAILESPTYNLPASEIAIPILNFIEQCQ